MVLLRFAPSPTGALHLGGLRTTLYNYLYAKKLGGECILRIEDTDSARRVPGSVDGIRSALLWAGLEYDYGPGKGGPHAPYYQLERLDLYRTYADRLLDSGHAYRCFCSADRLASTCEKLVRTGSNTTYDKHCLRLTDEEVARRVRSGEKSVVRLNDDNLPVRPSASDIVFGTRKDAHASIPTDPILLKTDLFPTYHLASVADDHEMGITHEWLISLPLHLDLYAALALTPPKFAHLPILLNPDGSKMSKRNGDVQVIDYMRLGWEPEAVLNCLALAGWGVQYVDPAAGSDPETPSHPHILREAPDSTTLLTMPELIAHFDLTALTHRHTSLDPAKLEYLNKRHLMRAWATPVGRTVLAQRMHASVKEAFPTSPFTTVDYIARVILTLELRPVARSLRPQSRLTVLNDIVTAGPYFFTDPDLASDEARRMLRTIAPADQVRTKAAARARLAAVADASWATTDFLALLHGEAAGLGLGMKTFMTVLRHALTGVKNGPGVPDIIGTLGRDRTLTRLANM